MANPVISNVSLDKANYAPGEQPILKFTVSDADTRDLTVEIKVTDAGGGVGTGTATIKVVDVANATVTDSDGGTWTLVSKVGLDYTFKRSAV